MHEPTDGPMLKLLPSALIRLDRDDGKISSNTAPPA
jgi:hypothetical protein